MIDEMLEIAYRTVFHTYTENHIVSTVDIILPMMGGKNELVSIQYFNSRHKHEALNHKAEQQVCMAIANQMKYMLDSQEVIEEPVYATDDETGDSDKVGEIKKDIDRKRVVFPTIISNHFGIVVSFVDQDEISDSEVKFLMGVFNE